MGNDSETLPGQWAGVTALVVGSLLMFNAIWFPATTDYTPQPQVYWNGIVTGGLIFLVAVWALTSESPVPNWIHAMLGFWLIGSPLTLNYGAGNTAGFNELTCGMILSVASIIGGLAKVDLMERRRGT